MIDAMRAFTRVVERCSFSLAAHDLVLPRSRMSEAVQQLERRLGVKLIVRTTRSVAPTPEGADYYQRCLAILGAIDDAEAAVANVVPAGPLRIDVHGTLARHFLLPSLAEFLGLYPAVELHIGEGDRLVDLIGEGIDCVVRVGDPKVSGLVGRKLGVLHEGTFASPAYLARRGLPLTPDELQGHSMIGFVSSRTRAVLPFEFQTPQGLRSVMLPASVTVTSSDTNACLAVHGLGLIQVPKYRVRAELERGELVEILHEFPPRPLPVYLLYAAGRQLSPRVRVFMDWVYTRDWEFATPATAGGAR